MEKIQYIILFNNSLDSHLNIGFSTILRSELFLINIFNCTNSLS